MPRHQELKPDRYAEVDVLKAAGIIAVVLIHSTRSRWDPGHSFGEIWLKQVLQFAVPGFLAVSGFLYATEVRVPGQVTLQRLRRILLPYLVASACAEVFYAYRGAPNSIATIAHNLAIGHSFGPFYYIFILVPLIAVAPILARTPARALWALLVVSILLQYLHLNHWIGGTDPTWRLRNPIAWSPYFLLGWLVRLHYSRLRTYLDAHRLRTATGLGVCVLVCWLAPAIPGLPKILFLTAWLGTYFALATLFVISGGRFVPAPVRWLSEATYPIYLFHLLFVLSASDAIRAEPGVFSPLTIAAITAMGLAGSFAIVSAARVTLGERSRDIVGA